MRKLISVALIVSTTAIGNVGSAAETDQVLQFMNGNELWSFCSSDPKTKVGLIAYGNCIGYILGVVDGSRTIPLLEGGHPSICYPKEISESQVVDVTKTFLKDNPSKRHLSASFLIMVAMKQAWPCASAELGAEK
jgi:Rap1a immunity proteins